MPLKLEVPPLSQERNLTPETRPRQVKEWLDRLPLANVPEAARQLTASLGTINRQELGDDARLKVVELYGPVVTGLVASIRRQFVAAPLPLSDRQRQAAYVGRQMLTELAYGYKIVLVHYGERRFTFGLSKHLPEILTRILVCFEEILAICYETYAPVPAGLWAEIYQVFQYALQSHIDLAPVAEGDGMTNIANVFRRILLLTVADPYHLMHGEVARTQEYLARFSDQATLQPAAEVTNAAGAFLVRLRSDKPPRPFGQQPSRDGRGDLALGAFDLAKLTHQHAGKLRHGEPPGTIGLPDSAQDSAYGELLRRLVKSWGLSPKRQYNRRASTGEIVQVCPGMRGLHFFLSKDRAVAGGEATSPAEGEVTIELGTMLTDTANVHLRTMTDWKVINDSANGMALRFSDEEKPVQVRVGDLVGVHHGGTTLWNVSVVRWMRSTDDGGVEIGVQLVAPNASPAFVKHLFTGGDQTWQPAILFPESPQITQPPMLAAPHGLFQELRKYELEHGGGVTIIRAAKLVEQTSSFDLFQFAPA